MDKIRKGSDLRKEKWGSPSIQKSKIAAKFSKRLSIRTVTPLWTRVHSYPMMPHAFTFHSCGNLFASLASCLPSWSAMHDVCVTCAKKCAVAMGANVLKFTAVEVQAICHDHHSHKVFGWPWRVSDICFKVTAR